jgi:hypothetical protein
MNEDTLSFGEEEVEETDSLDFTQEEIENTYITDKILNSHTEKCK